MRKWILKSQSNHAKHGYHAKSGKTKTVNDLILSRQWKAVRNWLFDKGMDRRNLLEKTDSGESTLLHSLCYVHPPITLVVKIVDLCPQLVLEKDERGRLPLHIATGWGASPQVVSFLLVMNIDAASTLDSGGKTPLIWAFENMKSCRTGCMKKDYVLADKGSPFCEKVPGPVEEVVQALVDAALEVVSIEDKSGNTAIDYAVENECNENSLRIIQLATAQNNQIRKEMKKQSFYKVPKLRLHTNESLCRIHPMLDERKFMRKETYTRIKSIMDGKNKSEEYRQRDKELMDFLGVPTEQSNYLDASLDFLKNSKLDALRAARLGFKATKFQKRLSIPPIIQVEYGVRDDVSEVS